MDLFICLLWVKTQTIEIYFLFTFEINSRWIFLYFLLKDQLPRDHFVHFFKDQLPWDHFKLPLSEVLLNLKEVQDPALSRLLNVIG